MALQPPAENGRFLRERGCAGVRGEIVNTPRPVFTTGLHTPLFFYLHHPLAIW